MSGNFASISYPSITAVVHQAVLRAPSGLDARIIAEVAGYRHYNTMMSELSRQQGHKLGADMLLPLMDAAQSNAPLEFLARQRGGVFLPLPEPACGGGELLQSLSRSIKEFGEFAAEAATDIADGDLPRTQLDRILKEGQEAVEAIMAMMRLARTTHEAQYGSSGRSGHLGSGA
ncbi:phage regulatory CII family protein [Megalodesulfovibrio paquesii]